MSGDDNTEPLESRRARQVSPSRVRRWVLRFGQRLFAESDARARRQGWQVTVERRGLARCYRDRRFDRFVRCPRCEGDGWEADSYRRCSVYQGDGRVVRAALTGGVS